MNWRDVSFYIFGCLIGAGVVLVLNGCGPNMAYMQRDWPRFHRECVVYCAPEEAHPSRTQDPWLCGCPDGLSEDDDE